MKRRAIPFSLLLILALLILVSPLLAFPHNTVRISLSPSGGEGNEASYTPAISRDGRFTAFVSGASNLVSNDTNGVLDVFVYDSGVGTIERVSVNAEGIQGNALSDKPDLSADGRFVVFHSRASNLVPSDTNNMSDIFVYDRELNTISRASVTSAGGQAVQGHSEFPSISADGRFVAFQSRATNLVPDDTSQTLEDIFVRDLQSGTTVRIASGSRAALSGDGSRVAFSSVQSDLVDSDTNQQQDIFVHDITTGETRRVSVNPVGDDANGVSSNPAISSDGQYVAFDSTALNLVPDDGNGPGIDVFVYNMQTSLTTRISGDSSVGSIIGTVGSISLSDNGQRIAFASPAPDLVSDDTNEVADIFVYDMPTSLIRRVSQGFRGEQANQSSAWPSLSGDGIFLAYHSNSSNLVPDDTNTKADLFITNLQPILPRIALASFTATRTEGSVLIRWDATSETSVSGYNVYRGSASGPTERLNSTLIPRHVLRMKSVVDSYEWSDTTPSSDSMYWLEVVGELAASEWFGPVGSGGQLYLPIMRE